MTCDIQESEDQRVVRYSGGLNESIRNVVELQHYTTLDEVCLLSLKVELQKKDNLKRELPKPTLFTRGASLLFLNPQTHLRTLPFLSLTPNHCLIPLRKEDDASSEEFGYIDSNCPR